MGVKGLWKLIEPVGRPIMLETMEGKALAIDSSIWIYQFQATMRDKEGRGLVNAHVLGFLRRICKLLFYGIKPVFVFDGGAPSLKRATIAERKRKKAGAAASHAQVAERILAAQLRRQAIVDAEQRSKHSNPHGVSKGPVIIDENTVYLEDLDNPNPASPPKASTSVPKDSPPSTDKKRNKWHDFDPYKLPDVDENTLPRATPSIVPDHRLATDEELRHFIETMTPADIDVTSPEFRSLSTEMQYELIGNLRLKSRQTSHKRLQTMIQKSKTPMDFSIAQIKGLKERNKLTQQLLMTTDSIGKHHIEIPVRIAAERNREYVLVKNTGNEGGWVLGIRDNGSAVNPIQVDLSSDNKDKSFDSDDENVNSFRNIRDFPMSLSSIGKGRSQDFERLPDTIESKKQADITPLFLPEEDEAFESFNITLNEDAHLQVAIQGSLEEQETRELREAIKLSKGEMSHAAQSIPPLQKASASRQFGMNPQHSTHGEDGGDDDSHYTPLHKIPSRLGTALTFANTTLKKSPWADAPGTNPMTTSPGFVAFSKPISLSETSTPSKSTIAVPTTNASDSEGSLEEVVIGGKGSPPRKFTRSKIEESELQCLHEKAKIPSLPAGAFDGCEDESVEVIEPEIGSPLQRKVDPFDDEEAASTTAYDWLHHLEVSSLAMDKSDEGHVGNSELASQELLSPPTNATFSKVVLYPDIQDSPVRIAPTLSESFATSTEDPCMTRVTSKNMAVNSGDEMDPNGDGIGVNDDGSEDEAVVADWDAAQEINVQEEEGEFARFASEIKGRDLAQVRNEIDEEIHALHQQRIVAMRDSEDVSRQMVSQIMVMLRLFGIPYMTAPMEAEAQCAELVRLGLVEGIITDDSDAFLFGGTRVLKNLFNQSQTVEVYLSTDLNRELELEREKLIRLAYLLGSDYVEGLPGVGPVIAMEIIREFPGESGLHKFREWWRQVQSGQDKAESLSSFKRKFKKRFKDLFLPSEWPNPAVRDAYIHPAVDNSEEPFRWGMPDLDGLREFFRNELTWRQEKVDELLLPIIRKMSQRSRANAMNKQGSLDPFLEKGPSGFIAAPRKREAYASKRLQQVVSDFRKQKKKAREEAIEKDEEVQVPALQKLKKTTRKRMKEAPSRTAKGKKRTAPQQESSEEGDVVTEKEVVPSAPLAVKLRPRPKRLKVFVQSDNEE